MTLTLPDLDTDGRPLRANASPAGTATAAATPGCAASPFPWKPAAHLAATWTVRFQSECGMFHDHDDFVSLCTRCLTGLRQIEDDDGTATILWTLPIDQE